MDGLGSFLFDQATGQDNTPCLLKEELKRGKRNMDIRKEFEHLQYFFDSYYNQTFYNADWKNSCCNF
ncbi:hypothetical protein I656_02777 [Geobacillus sp. WSUCF1]|nr:hypothetical protein I656_02777 [Geobacillus sp. WSUCF1]